ncbi:hypothetical protein ABMV07_11635 [Corynebacterium belfantii]|nr:hypothetical protein [Corynebacterium belfantii]
MSSLSSLGLDLLYGVDNLFASFFNFLENLLGGGIKPEDILPL